MTFSRSIMTKMIAYPEWCFHKDSVPIFLPSVRLGDIFVIYVDENVRLSGVLYELSFSVNYFYKVFA